MRDYIPTNRERPVKDRLIEWIAPGGEIVRGKYLGGVVWMPEGSDMYVYYEPQFWRYVEAAK